VLSFDALYLNTSNFIDMLNNILNLHINYLHYLRILTQISVQNVD